MNKSVIDTNKLKIQKEFLENEIIFIKHKFNIADSDTILFSVWTNVFLQTGFVFTEKGLYWNLNFKYSKNNLYKKKNYIEKNSAEKYEFSYNKILPEVIDFSPKEIKTENVFRIEIKSSDKNFMFNFITLDEDEIKLLTEVLKYGFIYNEIPKIRLDLINEVKKSEINEFCCLLKNKFNFIKNVFKNNNKKENVRKNKEKKVHSENKPSEKNLKENEVKKECVSRLRIFFANFLDYISSLIFISSVIMLFCNSLWLNLPDKVISIFADPEYYEIIEEKGRKVELSITSSGKENEHIDLNLNINAVEFENLPPKIEKFRNIILIINFILFFIFKFLITILIKGNKIISPLIILLSISSCFLISVKFSLFVTFTIISYLIFQVFSKFNWKSVLIKICLILISIIIVFLLLNILLNNTVKYDLLSIWYDFRDVLTQINLPKINWW